MKCSDKYCSAECSFFVLEKENHWVPIFLDWQRHLNSLVVLNIESDLTKAVSYDSMTVEFERRFVHRKKKGSI